MKLKYHKLAEHNFILVGVVFLAATRKGWFTQMSLYLSEDQNWMALCSANIKGKGANYQEHVIKNLGQNVKGILLNNNIRGLFENKRPETEEANELSFLKEFINETYPNANWIWIDIKELPTINKMAAR